MRETFRYMTKNGKYTIYESQFSGFFMIEHKRDIVQWIGRPAIANTENTTLFIKHIEDNLTDYVQIYFPESRHK